MNASQQELWSRLEAFQFDPPEVELTFAERLARDSGWSLGHARDVIEEYRRFLLLAVCAGHSVTPSEEVDQAWHLHLAYSVSYWDELCGRVLGRPLHHGPTQGGRHEDHKFRDWYAQTLESYARIFGTPAPTSIWPAIERRFAEAERFRRVDLHSNWVVPRHWGARAAIALTAVLATGCALGTSASRHGGVILLLAGFAVAVVLILRAQRAQRARSVAHRRSRKDSTKDGEHAGGCGFPMTGCSSSSHSDSPGSGDSGCGASGCGGGGGD